VAPEFEPSNRGEGETVTLSSELIVLSDPDSTAAESIRQLRTRLVAQHAERGRRLLALCSPGIDSGCTFIAANLAVSFAQIGTRVLLINADLRGSGLDRLFPELSSQPGLVELLTSGAKNPHAGYEILPSLWVMPSGGRSSNAQELLSTPRFEIFLNEAVREFDLTIIDTPPANLYADAHRIATVAGYCTIVARKHKTYVADVAELSRQLQADRVTVVGTILNQR
jgi:capsular exopolysaccharide synthesis family protein